MKQYADLISPLGEDLHFVHLDALEHISRPGHFTITAASRKADVDFNQLLGQHVTVRMHVPAELQATPRCFDGLVEQVSYLGQHEGLHQYLLVARSWFWFLTQTQDCKIFQDKTVVEIIDLVLADHAIAKVDKRLTGSYTPWVYCVQYRESDFHFLSRLMEQEGIHYFFTHEEGAHTLVLADDNGAGAACVGCNPLPVRAFDGATTPKGSALWQLRARQRVHSGTVALTDYDFTRPSAAMARSASTPGAHAPGDMEVFDYPGAYDQTGDGEQFSQHRMDATATAGSLTTAHTNAPMLACGGRIKASASPRTPDNIEYLVLATQIKVSQPSYEGGHAPAGAGYQCELQAIDVRAHYRTPTQTSKPTVQGPQTAVVVGPEGEEIHTDKYGRVKVQFHWDRYGQKNEKSSCWVRVSSPWAGKSFGFMQVPRIGQEVVVDFLEGDPDQPLITGRVYNAEQMPPWELPANATQSGVLTRSSKGGAYSHANALRFEDKKGEEQLWLHAEKDQLTEVEHDEDKWVGNDRRKTIDGNETTVVHKNRTETVDLNETITVHQNRTERVDLDETISIGVNRSESVGANESIHIGANRTEHVTANETIAIGANRSVTIGGNKTETVAIAKAETIGAAKALSIGAAYQVSVGGLMNTTVGLSDSAQVGLSKSTAVGVTYTITAGEEFRISVGKASLVMKADGTILIDGTKLAFTSSGPTKITGKDVDLNP